jgi:NAD(P)H-flavin reductase
MGASRKNARVTSSRPLSPSVQGIALELGPERLEFQAGQWIDVEVPTAGGSEKRAYSLASPPHASELEIAVTLVPGGTVSPALHGLAPGSEIVVDGPHGFFTRSGPLSAEPALLVATGTGLAPFRSMLLDAQTSAVAQPPITLLFGCRSEADILWREELEGLARAGRIRLEITLSRPGAGWRGRTGYVQHHVAELARELGRPHVFICGLNRMVSEVRAVCKQELGYARSHIHSERYD